MKKIISISLAIIILMFLFVNASQIFAAENIDLKNIKQNEIDSLVNDILRKSKTPGASIVLINENQTEYLAYGYANKTKNTEMAKNTLLEIGSMSKAFTGLGILLLEDQGKISLNDPIEKYIPWLYFNYKGTHKGKSINGTVNDLTVGNFLYQTSGIPFKSIGYIPEGVSDSSLEETIRTLVGTDLDFYPGDRYQYATINYDVLGYIIQLVSGQTYEDFIIENIIVPLGLDNTYLFQDKAIETGLLAQGHKMSFFQSQPYAPRYRGNTPAGYIISNAIDMERWMRIQMGLVEIPDQYERIIKKSHIGDTTVISHGSYYYAAGWDVNIRGEDIQHIGSNPNFSSMLIMQPEENLGICILTNMNSNAAEYLAKNILNIIQEKNVTRYTSDTYKSLDFTFSIILSLSLVLGCLFFVLLIIAVIG